MRHRAASAPAGRAGAADHDRPGSDRRRDARRPQLTFFNGHYDSWCYLPLLAFLTFDQEREQYLCAAVLRPGNVPATRGTTWACCAGCCPCCGRPFPRRGFSCGSTGALRRRRSSTSGCRATARLRGGDGQERRVAAPRRARPARGAGPERGQRPDRAGLDTRYRARTWDRDVVIKAEVVRLGDREPRDNPRFVVTNLRQTPRFLYDGSTAPAAHRKSDQGAARWPADRTARALSLLGQSTARASHRRRLRAVQELRLRAARTVCPRPGDVADRPAPQIGGDVVGSVRRVVLHLPTATPDLHAWRHIALALGARPG